jgi:hypothetical protein
MRSVAFAAVVVWSSGAVAAQEPEDAAAVAARVRAGGWLQQAKYRREPDGALAIWDTATAGGDVGGRWSPLLGEPQTLAYDNLGLPGYLSLVCHGDGDLLAMTDAAFHFGALGIDASDVGLRQFLAMPAPSFDGALGRAHLLDRLLAIDRLAVRAVRGAIAELTVLAKDETLPAVLRTRAGAAIARLRGEGGGDGVARRRLTADDVRLPAAFDAAIVIDHARLPDLRWVAPLGRRLGALVTVNAIEAAGGTVSAAACNGGQRMCDVPAEAPFGFAHRFGNARLDHSLVTVAVTEAAHLGVAFTWNAVGEIEHDGWTKAVVPDAARRDNPLLAGTMTVTATGVYASTDGQTHRSRPSLAAPLLGPEGDGYALRVVLPANSKTWPALAALGLPPANGGELRVTFGDPGVLVLAIDARDEDAAEAWAAKGKELLATAVAAWREALPDAVAANRDAKLLLDAVAGASFSVKDRSAFAVVEVRGFAVRDPDAWAAVLAELVD